MSPRQFALANPWIIVRPSTMEPDLGTIGKGCTKEHPARYLRNVMSWEKPR